MTITTPPTPPKEISTPDQPKPPDPTIHLLAGLPLPDSPEPDSEKMEIKISKSNESEPNTMIINKDYVVLHTSSEMVYKIVRVLNHFITHIITHHENTYHDVHKSATWYCKWNTIYPMIRSSRRTMIQVYRMLFEDYSIEEKNITVYSTVLKLK